jgi:hypothetical protein
MAAAHDPIVAPVLERVERARLRYVVEQFKALGLRSRAAEASGLLAYSAYLGVMHLGHAAPGALADDAARKRYVRHAIETLLPGNDAPDGGRLGKPETRSKP